MVIPVALPTIEPMKADYRRPSSRLGPRAACQIKALPRIARNHHLLQFLAVSIQGRKRNTMMRKLFFSVATLAFFSTPANAYTVYVADLYPICRVVITLGKNMNTMENPVVHDGPFSRGQSMRINSDAGGSGTVCAFTPLSNSDCGRGMNQIGLCNADLSPGQQQLRQLRAPN